MTTTNASFDEILTRCRDQRVTGVLHVLSDNQEAEIHFLSGIEDTVKLGAVEGAEALRQISGLPNPRFHATASLPPMSQSSQQAFPAEGDLGSVRPVELMRYCEDRCLTCTLHLECAGKQLVATYELGELKEIDPEAHMTISVLEATEGRYHIGLPEFALPNISSPGAVQEDLYEVAQKDLAPPPPRPSEELVSRLTPPLLEATDVESVAPAPPTIARRPRRVAPYVLTAAILAAALGFLASRSQSNAPGQERAEGNTIVERP